MEIGFVGLGSMGGGIAENLINAGHSLNVYNRTRSKAENLVKQGATLAETPAEACRSGVVATMLADDHAVAQVVWGESGILKGLPPGGVHISHSTIGTKLSRRLAEAHQEKAQMFVAAPVFGRPDAAAAGKLLVVAAGAPKAMERSRPELEAIGRKLMVVGDDPSAANVTKLAGNFLIASMLESLGESFALLRKCAVEPATFLDIVNNFFQSPVYENYGKAIIADRFEPAGFKMYLGLKDIRLILEAGEEKAAPLPIASLIRDRFLEGIAQGRQEQDWSAIARVAAASAGLTP